jgi:Flp pilus assembly protein TadB
MSKERALRRAEREREAAVRTAARAAEAERRERKEARARAVRRHTTDRLPRLSPAGRDSGALAHRRRVETSLLVAMMVAVNVLVWVVRPDVQARVGVLVVSVLVFPVLHVLLLPRR